MTKALLKQKLKKQHSHIDYMCGKITPVTSKQGKIIYIVSAGNSTFVIKNKKDAFKVFFNYVEKYMV